MEAIISSAVKSVGKLLAEEGNFLYGVRDQARLLHADLERVEWFLQYADRKQSERSNAHQWIADFTEIAYAANDAVEDYVFRVASKRRGFTNTLKRFSCILRESYHLHKLGFEVQSLRNRISDLTKNFNEYGVRAVIEEGASSSRQQKLERTFSFIPEDDFVGLENDVGKLVGYLMNEGEFGHCQVISVCGMGGLGKTTLARKVYQHPRLKSHFSGFGWACVSQQWKTEEILQGILVKLIPQERKEIMRSSEEDLVRKLYRELESRRCFIVLDDIWSREAWDCMKCAFPKETNSKLLLTTRNRDVAHYISPDGYHHLPRLLNEEESWQLLQKKALKARSFNGYEELGKKMIGYCSGLPLAVVVLGGILATKGSLKEWKIVHKNIKSYFERGEVIGQTEGEVPKVLSFSYYDLPYQLKPCFLYLGTFFSEDSDIETEQLYQLWTAEGLVFENDQMGSEESMMDVAQRYLEELAKRSMVQIELKEMPRYRRVAIKRVCRLHDLMRDLCLIKAKEENFFRVIDFVDESEFETFWFGRAAIILGQSRTLGNS